MGAKPFDLLEAGNRLEILRRERMLERRMLDGVLTATMPVEGAELGDVIRLAYSTTMRDHALGDQVQWQTQLPAKPIPLASGSVSISWPEGLPVSRVKHGEADVEDLVVRNGYQIWSAKLPVEKSTDVPSDAPMRYFLGELLQVSTYADWNTVSRLMSPHYGVENSVEPGGALAGEIENIAAQRDDALTRAALALQLVQDRVSYLLNGLNGGNYLPQAPEETWAKRFGDCKAKSVLLLAMLRELGIEGEIVLVRTIGGDALPMLAPMPANFDHMIVRAQIDGKEYWLDGTAGGTRLANIDEVPRFHYALPLRMEGSDLIALSERAQSTPDRILRVSFDHSAGIRLPAMVDVEIAYLGQMGAPWQTISRQNDDSAWEEIARGVVSELIGDMADRS
ncbi:transglutaminase-like domain-containing protein [Erythrobacter sp.]|uniref:transglutaminase-like domain-containing protein n=1 Tax=Erythrobacter sp. TaxID=1042 RepID=UPI002EA55F82|nr:DUF3857 domain-containing protein [Erythrobacter sp.]